MAIGVVAGDFAAGEPEDLRRAKIVAEVAFHVLTREGGVAIGIEQARFGREDAAAAVAVDRAPFEDDPRHEAAAALQLGDPPRHLVIEIEWRILAAPSVVFPIDQGRFWILDFGFWI